MWDWKRIILVLAVALIGVMCLALGETSLGIWVVTAAVCTALGITIPPVKKE